MEVATVTACWKKTEIKFYHLGRYVVTYVRICVFEAQKFVHLRAILADFPASRGLVCQ